MSYRFSAEQKKIHKEIRTEIREFLYMPDPPKYNLHINSFAGSGKTHICAEELDYTDSLFIFLMNQHKLNDEKKNDYEVFFDKIHMESRAKLCKNSEYKYLAKHGINIKHFCPGCPNINVCTYYQRILSLWEENQSWMGVHHHLGGLVNSYIDEMDIDVLVIDEYFLGAIRKNKKVYYTSIVPTYTLLTRMEDSIERNLIYDHLNEFSFAIQNGFVNNEFLDSQIWKYFRRQRGTAEDLRLFAEQYEMKLADFYFKKGRIFQNIVTEICETIIDIYNHRSPLNSPDGMKYINSVYQFTGNKRKYVDITRYDLEALNVACKVLVLDATTPTEFYQRLFDRKMKSINRIMPINSKIYQLKTAKFVMNTLDRSDKAMNRLLNIVKLIVKKHESPMLVISRMKYEEDIKNISPRFITTDHYPLLGSNEYEDIDICVVFGTPEPSNDVLERNSILLQCTQEELLYIERETNMIQAINRIRPALKLKRPTYIYILSSVKLPFRNVNMITIGELERLLKGEIKTYVTEETEDRIGADILDLLNIEPCTTSEIFKNIQGNNNVIMEIIRRLIEDNIIEKFTESKAGRGRKPTKYRLTD